MAVEARGFRALGEAVITRLANVLVIHAIRCWIETAPAARTGWLGALQDKEIGRALALIHRDPARDWTIASLASELALSRSAFAARFTEIVGEPAIRHVTRWRMQVATALTPSPGIGRDSRRSSGPTSLPSTATSAPTAALLDETARRPAATRQVFTDGLMDEIDGTGSRLDPTDLEAARTDALTVFGLIVGTLQLARALTDRDLSDRLLDQGAETALKMLDAFAR
jgi:hypothetical protein